MNKRYHIAYLSYDGLTDPLGQSQILPYILGLEAKGFKFSIFSFEKRATYKTGRNTIERIIKGRNIIWTPLAYHKSPPIFSTLLDLFLLWSAVKKGYEVNSYNIIHCRSYITSLVGLRMKRRAGVKFIFDMRGFWADERVEGGLWNLKNPVFKIVYHFFKKKERQFLEEADHVVSLTHNAKEEIEAWQINNAPITVIPTCVDLDLFDPAKINRQDQDALRTKLGINSTDFVLLYLGSWGTWYLTDEMLNFFSSLKSENHSAKFLIVSPDKINLNGYAHQKDVITVQAPRNLVPLFISVANASVFFIKPSFSKKASSATKMGEIMAMNVPVITNKGWGDVNRILKNTWDLPTSKSISVQDFLGAIVNGVEETRAQSIKLFDLKLGVEKYFNIYQNLIKPMHEN